jgi:drug/metabolite transporter (DMT)-like permease
MIVLDIVAPILLMFGIRGTTSGNSSLLNNFEIVATSIIALIIFKETISKKLWIAISLVTISSGLLTFDLSSLEFTWQSLLIIAAAICWGFENNFTRKISSKSSYEIVTIKGLCCGLGSIIIGFIIGEQIPLSIYLLYALILGFVAYGLSIFFYFKAQAKLGAAKTSAFYAINPFIGVILSLIILKEKPNWNFYVALAIMLAGTIFIVIDTLERRHTHMHMHIHIITHTHDGTTHTHIIEHSHPHYHFINEENHTHKHLHIHENEE